MGCPSPRLPTPLWSLGVALSGSEVMERQSSGGQLASIGRRGAICLLHMRPRCVPSPAYQVQRPCDLLFDEDNVSLRETPRLKEGHEMVHPNRSASHHNTSR